jgi:hypothetical protein
MTQSRVAGDGSAPDDDPILAEVVRDAQADPASVGLLVTGSRAEGWADAESDYDLIQILTDEERDRRERAGDELHVKRLRGTAVLDIVYSSVSRLRETAATPGWWSPGFAGSKVLLAKTDDILEVHRALTTMDETTAQAQVREQFDGYLNGYYRSLKAWRRGDELAGRIEAAESVMYLVRTLFALERTWAPYPKRLRARLRELEPQGWEPGYLEDRLRDIVSTGDPTAQQQLERRAQALIRARGYGDVVDAWEGEIERVSAFEF